MSELPDIPPLLGEHAAELLGDRPAWYVLRVMPGHERIAAAHLAARRFGVFLPEVRRRYGLGGPRKAKGALESSGGYRSASMFAGYIFGFFWDAEAHIGRLRSVPGVVDLLRRGDGSPAIVADWIIDRIQLLEFHEHGWGKPPRKRWRKRRWEAEDEADGGSQIMGIMPYSAMAGAASLDEVGRDSLLRLALGL